MTVDKPHYVLFSETSRHDESGRWRFVLRSTERNDSLEASDTEPYIRGERLELLTIVRALEALDQPSQVTLMTSDPYLRQGIRFGLPDWRANGWQWEYFGKMVPIKHGDLWQRMDHAMRFHQVEFCKWRIDGPHATPVGSTLAPTMTVVEVEAETDAEAETPVALKSLGVRRSSGGLQTRGWKWLGTLVAWCRRWLSRSRVTARPHFRFS
jgi:ribonuclease HI